MDERQGGDKKLTDLHRAYSGEFVAIYAGEIVDHDSDFQSLHLRIRQRYGRQPVLIRQVTEGERQWAFRSPRLEGLA